MGSVLRRDETSEVAEAKMKRFTDEEDRKIFDFDYFCAADLGRSERAVKDRIAKLKATGAWRVYEVIDYLEDATRRLLDKPLITDLTLTNEKRRELTLAMIDEIWPIVKHHSDIFSEESYYAAFPDERTDQERAE